jgi:CRP-like cAMP-binding protein
MKYHLVHEASGIRDFPYFRFVIAACFVDMREATHVTETGGEDMLKAVDLVTSHDSDTELATLPDTAADERHMISDLFKDRVQQKNYLPGGTIVLHGSRADTLYRVVSGTVRCCTITEDGRRQIFRFARAGDCLGLDEIDTWHYTAEAVDRVCLRSAPRAAVEREMAQNPQLQRAARQLVSRTLQSLEQQLMILAYMQADQRLQWFLIQFARGARKGAFVTLPMTRQDIGHHLGLTLETVSRAFGVLKRNGAIEMQGSDKYRILTD